MNYAPNEIDWKIGDLIIHDADAKKETCLARVVEIKESFIGKEYRIEYLDKKKNYDKWWNLKEVLHDPKRFGIVQGGKK